MSSDLRIDSAGAEQARPMRTECCEHCGAPREVGDHFCQACGLPFADAQSPKSTPAKRFFRCQTCGAAVTVDANTRSFTCCFCDSTYVSEFAPEQSGRQEPEFVIGFGIPPEEAMRMFRRWLVAGGWYRPGDIKDAEPERMRGVYLPFWSFSTRAESAWTARIGEFWYRTEIYTTMVDGKTETHTRQVQETEWYPLAGRRHAFYSGYLVSASRGLPQSDAAGVQPFQTAALKRYNPGYLAGWLSEEYGMACDEAREQTLAYFSHCIDADLKAFMPGDTHTQLKHETAFRDVRSDLILLPIYLLNYRYGPKRYRFLLNGQTGKMAGTRPVSAMRIGIAAAATVLLVLIVWLLLQYFSH